MDIFTWFKTALMYIFGIVPKYTDIKLNNDSENDSQMKYY